jgi:hypothetical protein
MDTKMNELQTRDHESDNISVMDEREVLGKHLSAKCPRSAAGSAWEWL